MHFIPSHCTEKKCLDPKRDERGCGEGNQELIAERPPFSDRRYAKWGRPNQVPTSEGRAINPQQVMANAKFAGNHFCRPNLPLSRPLAIVDGNGMLWPEHPGQSRRIHPARKQERSGHCFQIVR